MRWGAFLALAVVASVNLVAAESARVRTETQAQTLNGKFIPPLLAVEPMAIEVGLDARLAAAGIKLEIQEADEVLVGRAVPSDRIESPPVHERMLRFENVRVEYPAELAEFAGAFGLWADQAQPKFAKAFEEMRAQVIEAQRGQSEEQATDERMRWLAQWLALEEPPEISRETYERMSGLIRQLVREARFEEFMIFDRFLIFTETGLVERLKTGEAINNFGLAEPGMARPWTFTWGIGFNLSSEMERVAFKPLGRYLELAVPIVIPHPEAPILKQLDFARKEAHQLFQISREAYVAAVTSLIQLRQFIAMHEAAEIGLARSTLQSKDRRWFLDGMANYIAREYIRKIAGDEGAETVWRTAYASVTKADAIRKADIWNWPAAKNEDDEPTEVEQQLTYARYVLATETIAAIAEAHGQGFLPRWCAEIRRTPLADADMNTVRNAFTTLTEGEDVEKYVEQARSLLAD